jgi:hypothetical protein
MTARQGQTRYVLTITPTWGQAPTVVRLRGLLKSLLRAYGFRCVTVQQVDAPQVSGDQASATGHADGSAGHGDR